MIPAQLKVIQHDRVKYACRHCQTDGLSGNVAIADKPPQPIEKDQPAAGLCSYSVLSKFGDHQPLYRTEDITSRFGYTIRRSTLCGWQAQLAELALPLVMRMKHLLLKSKVIHTDGHVDQAARRQRHRSHGEVLALPWRRRSSLHRV